jgi:beta-mannosidase
LLRAGRNRISIRFESAMEYIRTHRRSHQPREFNDPVGRSQVIRKQPCQFGWDWGPRFVTAGIWREIRIESWSGNRLAQVRLRQSHPAPGVVTIQIEPELVRADAAAECHWTIGLGEITVARGKGTTIEVANPQLWWPNGHGDQPLYRVSVRIHDRSGSPIGEWSGRIGLRTIELDRGRDRAGERFRFVVNGRPIFAKGANWIPAHSFVAGLGREACARDLRSATRANMNMIRVWGGGIYESEDFYDLCDELGLLVWQDFMFACSIYPGDAAFVRSVREEARHQIRRLRHRACLALWCGNNEIAQLNGGNTGPIDLRKPGKHRRDYEAVFHKALPDAVAKHDGVTAYWPSSQWRGTLENSVNSTGCHHDGERRGDTHFWDVWHARRPVQDYEKWRFRFVSEFGMQSYSSPETNHTFSPPHDDNVFGPDMENHQKNAAGNQIILDYVSRRYRFPISQDALIYLSQLNQAHCLQVGVEHYRRTMPHCMGALYWQLNDCWPAASWSSIEFTGRWRALHHVARRFFAPAIVSAHVPGEETTGIGNYRRSTVRHVHLHTVSDLINPTRAELRWHLFLLDRSIVLHGAKRVLLRYGESVLQKTLDLGRAIERHGRDSLQLRIALHVDGCRVSEDTVFLAPPRYVKLGDAATTAEIARESATRYRVRFATDHFQHRFAFNFTGMEHWSDDNYFELYPDEPRDVAVYFRQPQEEAAVRAALVHRSLVNTY